MYSAFHLRLRLRRRRRRKCLLPPFSRESQVVDVDVEFLCACWRSSASLAQAEPRDNLGFIWR